MRLRLGTPRVTLVVAPHPDDEAIGAGRLIGALRRRGARVVVVVVTDGAASHTHSPRWPPARLVAERRRETRRALRRLGVHAGDITFLNLPDGALPGHAIAGERAIRREVARRPGLDLLVGPAGDDHHPDHRAVAAALARCTAAPRRLAYRVWPAQRQGSGRTLRLPVAAAGAIGKRSLIRCHRTQCGAVRDDPSGFTIARHELDAFAHPIEWFEELR